ncbi:MAG: acylneuraminate cytidylyltransferase family protein [Minisyncoccia bacterium]|jgi:N-acylneuraminate cytidylyltransferase/CMP-N,N'-diacetyllegionaminic acid synthase
MKRPSVLAYIPARGGSKRISHKNTRLFAGKPLIARTIKQAKQLKFVDRIIVDTDSAGIADIAKKYGAEVPYLRPARLAGDKSPVVESILYLLTHLAKEDYKPAYVLLLQTTSPLRELTDIEASWKRMQEGDATTVLTVCPTHPQLYYLNPKGELVLANKKAVEHSNTQAWRAGYMLNGCFVYIIKTAALLRERKIITKKTKAVVCPRWRSVDLDTPEDWIMAEFLERNKKKIKRAIENFT